MKVRLVVQVKNRASVRNLVHATRYEPVLVDAPHGIIGFDVPYLHVITVLDQLAKCGVSEFLAHLTPTPETHDSGGAGVMANR